MKLFVIVATFSGLVALSTAQDQADIGNLRRLGGGRGGGRGGGGGKYGGGKDGGGMYGGGKGDGGTDGGGKHGGGNKGGIFSMMKGNCYWGAGDSQPLLTRLQEECDVLSGANPSYCAEVAGLDCARDGWKTMDDDDGTSALFAGCTEDMTDEQTEAMMSIAEAKKETWMEMTDADRAAYIEEKQGFRADNKALVLGCGCCVNENDVTPASALIKDREGAVAMTLGFRMPSEDGEGGGHGFGGGGHHGGGGDLAAKLTEMIATECTDDFVAAECDDGTMDCTFEKPETSNVVAIFEDPESVAVGLDGDKASQLKREFQFKKERCHQNMLKCACCAEMTVEEILAAKEAAKGDHEGSRPSGGAWSGRPEGMGEVGGGMFGENSSSGDESSGDESSGDEPSGDESQSQGVSDGDSSELGGDVSQPQGGSEGDSSGPEDGDRDIDAALEGKCSSFTAKGACQSMEAKNGGSMNCSNFDSTKMKRGRKKKYMLYCGCCL